jgi:hypothetical protein
MQHIGRLVEMFEPIVIQESKYLYNSRKLRNGKVERVFNIIRALVILARYAVPDGFMRWRIAPDTRGVGYLLDVLVGTVEDYYVKLDGKQTPKETTGNIMREDGYIKLKYYFSVEGVDKPVYVNIRLHVLLARFIRTIYA